jgi:hypothetical protein
MLNKRLAGRWLLCLFLLAGLPACTAIAVTGAVVGAVASVAVEIVEVPFEVAGAAYDMATDDDEDENEDDDD